MKRFNFAALAVIIIIAAAGCGNNKTGNIAIVFKGTYGNDPLVMLEEYDYAFEEKIQFTKSDFYVTNIQLGAPSGLGELIVEAELIDLSYTNEADAENGFEISVKDVPTGTYNRFNFGIGVEQVLNATMPEDWPASHALSEPRYWETESSYIFAKIEGNLDTLASGNADLEWAYHTGTNKLYVSLSTNSQLTIEDGGTTRIIFTLDHEKLFGVGDGPIDIKKNPVNEGVQDSVEIIQIVANYTKSLTFVIE
jgi:hypothetical protein